MKLKELNGIPALAISEFGERAITGLTSDSRQVQKGYVFAALKGVKADGIAYAQDAVKRGASVIIASSGAKLGNIGAPIIYVDDPRRTLALAAASFYGSQPDVMVAITGTSGKTSVASFTRQIWAQAGFASASIGTTGVISPTRDDYGSLTTPDPVELHKLLSELVEEGVTHAAMEASSHGLDPRRLDGVKLDGRCVHQSRPGSYGLPPHGQKNITRPSCGFSQNSCRKVRPRSFLPTILFPRRQSPRHGGKLAAKY